MGAAPPGPAGAQGQRGAEPEHLVVVGRVAGAYGVHGWVRVVSFCDPPENLLAYSPWQVEGADRWTRAQPEIGRVHGKGVVVRLAGCEDRERAEALAGALVAIERHQLPPLQAGEYYWADLTGLRVQGRQGEDLGVVTGLIETGANDVLVVCGDRERLIPFVPDAVVLEVDLAAGRIRVDWDPDF